jgi:hypothetical protein
MLYIELCHTGQPLLHLCVRVLALLIRENRRGAMGMDFTLSKLGRKYHQESFHLRPT